MAFCNGRGTYNGLGSNAETKLRNKERPLAAPLEGEPAPHQHAQMLLWRSVGMCVCVCVCVSLQV